MRASRQKPGTSKELVSENEDNLKFTVGTDTWRK